MGKKFGLYCSDVRTLNQDTLLEYKEVVTRYPYCQYAQLMFLLNLKQTGNEDTFKTVLPFAAISLPNRRRLKEWVAALQKPAENAAGSYPAPQARPGSYKFSPFQDSLPQRAEEGFSPWISALPVSSAPVAPKAPQTPPYSPQIEEQPLFRPIVPPAGPQYPPAAPQPQPQAPQQTQAQAAPRPQAAPQPQPQAPQPVPVDKVRSLLNRRESDAIIDRFMQGGEHHIKVDESVDYAALDPDTGGSNVEDFSLGSETLAEMYLKNGAPHKAIAVYRNLGLKFPEKSVYFANLIQKVKREYRIN